MINLLDESMFKVKELRKNKVKELIFICILYLYFIFYLRLFSGLLCKIKVFFLFIFNLNFFVRYN